MLAIKDLKIGVLDNGLHHETVFGGYTKHLIVPGREGSLVPERFHLLLIPFHTDQAALSHHRREIEGYVAKGGTLVVFGACDLANTKWIPFCGWSSEYTYQTLPNAESKNLAKLFKGLRGSDMKLHTKYHAHGALVPRNHKATEVILTSEDKLPVMVVVKPKGGGLAIISTLDPDHHLLESVAGPKKMTSKRARNNAQKLFDNVMSFAIDTARAAPPTIGWHCPEGRRIFLSHSSKNKPTVDRVERLLTAMGLEPWFDKKDIKAGDPLHRSIQKGMAESCAAVFFVTPDFRDDRYIAKEIDLAMEEKMRKQDRFAIITIVLQKGRRLPANVPNSLRDYVYEPCIDELHAAETIIRSLPIFVRTFDWR